MEYGQVSRKLFQKLFLQRRDILVFHCIDLSQPRRGCINIPKLKGGDTMRTKAITTLTSILFTAIMAFNIAPASAARVQLIYDDGAMDFSVDPTTIAPPVPGITVPEAGLMFYPSADFTHLPKKGEYTVVKVAFYLDGPPYDFIVHIRNSTFSDMVTPLTVSPSAAGFIPPGWFEIRLPKAQQAKVKEPYLVSIEWLLPAFEPYLGVDGSYVRPDYCLYYDPTTSVWEVYAVETFMIRCTIRYAGPP